MWSITNHTPYKAKKTWGRDKDGVHEWIVAVKGTYDIKADGTVVLANEQLDPLLAPEYNGEPGVSSLRYDADLVAPKPTTDVVINGTAYAPKGRPSTEFLVSVRVAQIHKVIRVVGNRRWKRGLFGLKPSKAEPITQLPIIYERAYGGYDQTDPDPKKQRMDPRNPVGCGVVAKSKKSAGAAAPEFPVSQGKYREGRPSRFWCNRQPLVSSPRADGHLR